MEARLHAAPQKPSKEQRTPKAHAVPEGWRSLDTLTVPEISVILRVSLTSAYKAVRSGQIPSVKIGKRDIISRRVIERMLDGAA